MIDVQTEHLRLLTKASSDVPGNPHVSTLIRWALRGVRGVQLETLVVGGRRFTSVEALQRFFVALNRPTTAAPVAAPATRQRDLARVEQELDAERI